MAKGAVATLLMKRPAVLYKFKFQTLEEQTTNYSQVYLYILQALIRE